MDIIGGHYVKWSKPGSERQRLHVFSHKWKIIQKTKTYTQKQTWSYTNSYVERVCNSGTTLWNLGKGGKGKENDRASTIL
jgi:hypothetical protein